ncbi:transcriptional regulator domain-containing protein [Sphingomonas sanguinis]|uniref:transcriptional regulator domain-containing protein n=1 Tax=Sphingomonas sanguinis TaxID=33051 RepID=UPI001F4D0795|nr:DUF6499 domain-containing protein [Sphingomonas sanguinis]
MTPDLSEWHSNASYAVFEVADISGLAWECLRRNPGYQDDYRKLVSKRLEALPLSPDVQRRWGLRFRRPTKPSRRFAGRRVVATG